VTALLAASLERAARQQGLGEGDQPAHLGMERLLKAWMHATKTDDREAMLPTRDVDVLPNGGRSDDREAVRRWQDASRGREVGTPEHPVLIDSTTYPDATGKIWS